jgi:hypothetical protein
MAFVSRVSMKTPLFVPARPASVMKPGSSVPMNRGVPIVATNAHLLTLRRKIRQCDTSRTGEGVLDDAWDNKRRVLRWDPYLEPDENDMQFRLTYEGKLLAHRDNDRLVERSLHVHDIRREWHKQLKALWQKHPVLARMEATAKERDGGEHLMAPIFRSDDFRWRSMVTEQNKLICALDILMLREGRPGKVVYDLDNRVKTIFDALRKAKNHYELGSKTSLGVRKPGLDEDPFYVLLEDDGLITHVSVTTDTLLAPVPGTTPDDAVRLVINVTVRPYEVHFGSINYA